MKETRGRVHEAFKNFPRPCEHLPLIGVTSEVGWNPQMVLFGGAREKTAGIRLFFVLPFCFFIPLFRSFPARRLDGYLQSRTQDENAILSRLK